MRRKQGISLIVLVITILVMIILAASVVITLNNTGVIDKASQAVKLTDEKQVQDLATLAWAEAYLDEKRTDTIENVVKDKLEEQGVTDEDWNIEVTDTGVTVTKKDNSTTTSKQLSGTWLLNETLVNNYEITPIAINFTSNGAEYSYMRMSYNGAEDNLFVYMNADYTVNDNAWSVSEDWSIVGYRIVDFGAVPQEVTEEFYIWFTTNATKLTESINPENGKRIITFRRVFNGWLDNLGDIYHAEEGMTWEAWLASEYNTSSLEKEQGIIRLYEGKVVRYRNAEIESFMQYLSAVSTWNIQNSTDVILHHEVYVG